MIHDDRYARPFLSEDEVEALRQKLAAIAPRIRREHLLELADTLHDAARAHRRSAPEGVRYDARI